MVKEGCFRKIANFLLGTPQEIYAALDALKLNDLDGKDVESLISNEGIERCKDCDWWFESHELQFVDEWDGGLCEQCCNSNNIEWV